MILHHLGVIALFIAFSVTVFVIAALKGQSIEDEELNKYSPNPFAGNCGRAAQHGDDQSLNIAHVGSARSSTTPAKATPIARASSPLQTDWRPYRRILTKLNKQYPL